MTGWHMPFRILAGIRCCCSSSFRCLESLLILDHFIPGRHLPLHGRVPGCVVSMVGTLLRRLAHLAFHLHRSRDDLPQTPLFAQPFRSVFTTAHLTAAIFNGRYRPYDYLPGDCELAVFAASSCLMDGRFDPVPAIWLAAPDWRWQ